ncbi:hypothetical protein [Marinomonas epiphytica]
MKKIITALAIMPLLASSHAWSADVSGSWKLVNAGDTQAQLEEAVERVAKEMNFFIRALARPVLREQTQVCQQWQLDLNSQSFLWQCDENDADELPLNAAGEVYKVDEEKIEISGTLQQTNDSIITILESERGKRTNTWQQISDNELLFTVKLESEKLPTPLTWSLTYQK